MPRGSRGFTIIELVMVIVIMGIIMVTSVNFISQTTEGYQDAAKRAQMAAIGIIASEKITRDLRNALPNSVRLDATARCLELIPTVAASHYLDAPVVAPADRFNVVRVRGYPVIGANERVAVYPDDPATLYSQSNPGPLSVARVAQLNLVAGDEFQLILSASHQFSTASPEKRFYITRHPVTYCFRSTRLYKYRDYGIHAAPLTALANEEVIVDRISAGTGGFEVTEASLARNSVVRVFFTLADPVTGESQQVEQEVQVRNVP